MNNIIDSKDYFTFNEVGYYLELNNCRPLDDATLFTLLKDLILEDKLSAVIHFKGDCILEEQTHIIKSNNNDELNISHEKDSHSSSMYLNLYCEIDYVDLYSLFKDYKTFVKGVSVANLQYKKLQLYPISTSEMVKGFSKDDNKCTFKYFYINDESFTISINNVRFYKEQIISLLNTGTLSDKERLAEAHSKIKLLENELEKCMKNTNATEKQGDSLLILGAVMQCIKEVAKPNYTQQNLIDAIIERYGNAEGISESTLKKKFPEAKTYLNQRFN